MIGKVRFPFCAENRSANERFRDERNASPHPMPRGEGTAIDLGLNFRRADVVRGLVIQEKSVSSRGSNAGVSAALVSERSAYRPSLMLLGKPFCQLEGAFQGREDMFSDSAVLHPLPPRPIARQLKASKNIFSHVFMSKLCGPDGGVNTGLSHVMGEGESSSALFINKWPSRLRELHRVSSLASRWRCCVRLEGS